MPGQKKPDAQAKVPSYIQPSGCFIVFANTKRGWEPLEGTPCAHYVAHLLGLKADPSKGGYGCNDGYELRVKALVKQLVEVPVADVKVDDVWARLKGEPTANSKGSEPTDHCGIVIKVEPAKAAGEKPTITIRHNSSGQRKVAENDWAYFGHGGKFYRKSSTASRVLPPDVILNKVRSSHRLGLKAMEFVKG